MFHIFASNSIFLSCESVFHSKYFVLESFVYILLLFFKSPEFEKYSGDQQYAAFLQQYRNEILPPDHRASVTVRRVGSRLASAAEKFIQEQGALNQKTVYKASSPYTYTVVRSNMANAFVLPNNHVFVLTGLFKCVKDEDELAAVLGHEIAHNLARHAGERLSGSFLTNILARFILILDPTGLLYSIFIPAATLLHDLPHSREHEMEADHIGMHLAAEACYDPRAAARVFSAMKHANHDDEDGDSWSSRIAMSKTSPPEFISTHPSYDTRISNFEEWMPEALVKFNADNGVKCRMIREEMKLARQRAALDASRRESLREVTATKPLSPSELKPPPSFEAW